MKKTFLRNSSFITVCIGAFFLLMLFIIWDTRSDISDLKEGQQAVLDFTKTLPAYKKYMEENYVDKKKYDSVENENTILKAKNDNLIAFGDSTLNKLNIVNGKWGTTNGKLTILSANYNKLYKKFQVATNDINTHLATIKSLEAQLKNAPTKQEKDSLTSVISNLQAELTTKNTDNQTLKASLDILSKNIDAGSIEVGYKEEKTTFFKDLKQGVTIKKAKAKKIEKVKIKFKTFDGVSTVKIAIKVTVNSKNTSNNTSINQGTGEYEFLVATKNVYNINIYEISTQQQLLTKTIVIDFDNKGKFSWGLQ